MLTVEINSRRGIGRRAAVGHGDRGAEQDEDVPVCSVGSHSLSAAEERGGEAGAAWREGFLFPGSSSSTMGSFHQAGISSGAERAASAVPGKVTSGADVLPGSGRDTTRQRDFQMCLGSKIQSPIPLAHDATRLVLLLPNVASERGRSRRVRTPRPGHPRPSQGIALRKAPRDPAPSLLQTCAWV